MTDQKTENKTFLEPKTRTYLFQTLDPLHVGTGGTRLGRVDNTITRDPATRLPKVPGSGLSGAVKDAYDLKTLIETQNLKADGRPEKKRCAGAKGCGNKECKVCALFGTAPPEEMGGGDSGRRGIIAFRDARLVAMPIASLMGPVWITEQDFALSFGLITLDGKSLKGIKSQDPNVLASTDLQWMDKVNIGSFLFPLSSEMTLNTINDQTIQNKITFLTKENSNGPGAKGFVKILQRMVICHSTVFPFLVDTAMEVRTSVTIDPCTGAAEPKKLFTLEAVPAGAIFQIEIDFLGGEMPKAFRNQKEDWNIFKEIEDHGFPYLEMTGLGGNVTRGFGRVRFLGSARKGD